MKGIERILVAMDLSGTDYRLLNFVKWLAASHPGLQAHFLHVTQPLGIPVMAGGMSDIQRNLPDIRQQFKLEMEEEVFAKLEDAPIELNFEVAEGNVTGELLLYTHRLDVDLVLVGQKEHSLGSGVGVRRFLRNSPASVLFVPEHAGTNIDHILVPVDFSDCSARAVEATLELARRLTLKPEITLLHVLDIPAAAHFRLNERYTDTVRQYERSVDAYFPTFLSRFEPGELRLRTAVVDNSYFNTARNIANYAREHMADLVVMGAKGQATTTDFLLGAVTEKFLAYNENIPVLIMK